MKIEKPDWYSLFGNPSSDFKGCLDTWFNKNVEPINRMLEKAVEVSGNVDQFSMSMWRATKGRGTEDNTHKALLINIQPIKKETAEDVLRDIIENEFRSMSTALLNRAKAVLNEA